MRIDKNTIVSYIEQLVKIPSPTGYTKQIEDFLVNHAKERNIAIEQTKKGAVIYKFEAGDASESVMFAAHVDTLGAMVKEVKQDRILLYPVGSVPILYIIGDYCQIHTFGGSVYEGTILPENPAHHVNANVDKTEMKAENLWVRVDIALRDNDDSLENYIEVGNFISFAPQFKYVNGFVKSRHLDDKASAGILLYLADTLNETSLNLKKNVYLFYNVTEETIQGIAGFPDIDEFIVVDMGVVGEGVAGDEFHVSICAQDTAGPYNYDLTQQLIRISKQYNLDYVVDIFPRYVSDGTAALRAGHDVAVALLGPGVSASHGYERTHVNALSNTAKLLWRFISQECLA
jgi:putative aminopeptidase FrvX